jgi:hypothetical protein
MFDKYYAHAVNQFAQERMRYLTKGGVAAGIHDEAFAIVGHIAQQARAAYIAEYEPK